ncbi:LPS export ABC transporter periplasmic protein LptC [Aliiglaciecola sp. CAU 1673]|uniref:LPS export ABC transporter periplasmic protein LptC n=1 Tax=Aliiglaciecola sp. CAU 1673 TaxID=3032595 RepID=UPI0023DC3EF9|nr:LPS export ABC transporter periplasmic protein LptC [Aliiglaciecola sp. CAU 1673]MDF2178473.1 LPS export ABC transporter periplasmic protein LptC [Aliiglaciecola sp. CAU 1673]
MINRLTLSIALLFVLILALNSHWWLPSEQTPTTKQGEEAWQPNYQATNMQTSLYNEQGALAHSIQAKRMEHYDLLGFTLFEQPQYRIFVDPDEPPWEVMADEATLYEDNRIQLETNVKIRSLNPEGFIQTIVTDFIEIDLNTKIMTSDEPVVISGQEYKINSNGFWADLNTKQFELRDHVQTIYGKNIF